MKWKVGASKAVIVLLFFILIYISLEAGALRLWLDVPPAPVPSENIDCDDVALKTYQKFSQIGVKTTIMLWFAHEKGKPWSQESDDHVWVVVNGPFGITIPIEYGVPYFVQPKFFQGTPITEEQLLEFVRQDFGKQQQLHLTGPP